jgi:hypothetical protein
MESTIDGHHTSPEEALEHKQLFESIERKLSPLAFFLLQVSVDPPEQLVREFNVQRELGATHFVEMPMKFVIEYVSRLVNLPAIDLKVAGSEVNSFLRSVGA